VANDGQHGQIDVISGEYPFVTWPVIDYFEGFWALSYNLGKTFHDLGGLAPDHPRLSFPVDKELIYQTESWVFCDMIKDNRVIRFSNESPHMVQFHGFLDMDVVTPMGFKKCMEIHLHDMHPPF
jgi:hypothetical protein